MQIVIEIDEETYKNVLHQVDDIDSISVDALELEEAIYNGTPLPKGHGDLVDFDRLCEEYWDGNYMEIHKDDLSNIKPIIEADGGGENAD